MASRLLLMLADWSRLFEYRTPGRRARNAGQIAIMINGTNVSQEQVAGFLLGLGIGLVIGLIFQPQSGAGSRGLNRENVKQAESSRIESSRMGNREAI